MVIIAHTHTHTTWTVQMKCKRQRGEKEELKEMQKRKWSAIWQKKEKVKKKKVVGMQMWSQKVQEERGSIMCWADLGAMGLSIQGPVGDSGQISVVIIMLGGRSSPSISQAPPSISNSISLPGQRWGGLGSSGRWRVRQGELGVGGCR